MKNTTAISPSPNPSLVSHWMNLPRAFSATQTRVGEGWGIDLKADKRLTGHSLETLRAATLKGVSNSIV